MPSGLTIIVASADPVRLHAALSMATAYRLTDEEASVFVQSEAVTVLGEPLGGDVPAPFPWGGIADLGEMYEGALDAGVEVIVCEMGLELAGMTLADVPQGIDPGNLAEVLAGLGDRRLVVV